MIASSPEEWEEHPDDQLALAIRPPKRSKDSSGDADGEGIMGEYSEEVFVHRNWQGEGRAWWCRGRTNCVVK